MGSTSEKSWFEFFGVSGSCKNAKKLEQQKYLCNFSGLVVTHGHTNSSTFLENRKLKNRPKPRKPKANRKLALQNMMRSSGCEILDISIPENAKEISKLEIYFVMLVMLPACRHVIPLYYNSYFDGKIWNLPEYSTSPIRIKHSFCRPNNQQACTWEFRSFGQFSVVQVVVKKKILPRHVACGAWTGKRWRCGHQWNPEFWGSGQSGFMFLQT
jgi:hypothetical protein